MSEEICLPDPTRCQGCPIASEAVEATRKALQERINRDKLDPKNVVLSVTCDLSFGSRSRRVDVISSYSGTNKGMLFGGTTNFKKETIDCNNFRLLIKP